MSKHVTFLILSICFFCLNIFLGALVSAVSEPQRYFDFKTKCSALAILKCHIHFTIFLNAISII